MEDILKFVFRKLHKNTLTQNFGGWKNPLTYINSTGEKKGVGWVVFFFE